MTGEVTLRGRVIGVGGLKEKLLAAKQYNIKTVVVPEENRDDIEEIIKEIKGGLGLDIIYAATMDDVLKAVLKNNPFVTPAKTAKSKKTVSKKTKKKTVAKKAKKQ